MARGYGIILVIIGHFPSGVVGKAIYTFHMPLFFFLSGYLFDAFGKTFGKTVLHKIKTMLVPYTCLGIIMVIFNWIWMMDWRYERLEALFWRLLEQKRFWTLWFLACLFLTEIIFYLMVRLFKDNLLLLGIASVALATAGCIYYRYGGQPVCWNVDVCMISILFYYGGYLLGNLSSLQERLFEKWQRIGWFTLSFVICLVCGMTSFGLSGQTLEMYHCQYGIEPLSFVAAFAGIVCVLIISSMGYWKPIAYIGKNSLIYFAWHQTIMMPIFQKICVQNQWFQDKTILDRTLYVTVGTVSILVVLSLVNLVIRKTSLRFMVGS